MRKNDGITSDTKGERVFDDSKSIGPARYLDLDCTSTPVFKGITSEFKEKKDFASIKSVRNESERAETRESLQIQRGNAFLMV